MEKVYKIFIAIHNMCMNMIYLLFHSTFLQSFIICYIANYFVNDCLNTLQRVMLMKTYMVRYAHIMLCWLWTFQRLYLWFYYQMQAYNGLSNQVRVNCKDIFYALMLNTTILFPFNYYKLQLQTFVNTLYKQPYLFTYAIVKYLVHVHVRACTHINTNMCISCYKDNTLS